MNSPLFRPEATQAHSAAWLGAIRIGHNPRFAVVAGVALLLAAGLAWFAVHGQATRKARVAGLLAPAGGTSTWPPRRPAR